MARLNWQVDIPQHEYGIDRGIVFPQTGPGVPWYGLVRVDEINEASEVESYFIDGVEVGKSNPLEDFSATVEAFTYPEILDHRDYVFGFSYRTKIGVNGSYELHFVYNATFDVPSETETTISSMVDPKNFIFVLDTTQVDVRKTRPFAHMSIISDEVHPLKLRDIEDHLYGTDESEPAMPDPEWVMEILDTWIFGYGHGPYGHYPYGGNE